MGKADALLIESRAKMRLADEYDAAQDRGEVKSKRGPIASGPEVIATVSDIGLTHKDVHDARESKAAKLQAGKVFPAWKGFRRPLIGHSRPRGANRLQADGYSKLCYN